MTRSNRSTTDPKDDLISLEMAIVDGCRKLRLPHWANPADYIEIMVTATGALGPWVDLWSPANMALNEKNPTRLLWTIIWPRFDMKARVWLPYGGPAGTPYPEPPQEHPIGGNDGRLGTTEAEAREMEHERQTAGDDHHAAAGDTSGLDTGPTVRSDGGGPAKDGEHRG